MDNLRNQILVGQTKAVREFRHIHVSATLANLAILVHRCVEPHRGRDAIACGSLGTSSGAPLPESPSPAAHAALLLSHVYALLKLPNPTLHYFAQSEPFFLQRGCEPWEKACAVAVKASVAAAVGQTEAHASSYREAERLIGALPDPQDREILHATLRVVPQPRPGGVTSTR